MKIETLGGLLKAARRGGENHVGAYSPLHARAMVYQAMGNYILQVAHLVDSDATQTRAATEAMGGLIHVLAIDAQASLTPEKFNLLEDYPLTEDGQTGTLDREALRDSLVHTWGESDVFIERLSGGLFGSYFKALSALKPQARAMGHDLSTAATLHIEHILRSTPWD